MRILIVEDHLLFQQSLGHMLNDQPDITVVGGAVSVQEAVEQARLLKPDCILMDFTLRDGTGLEATKAILAEQPAIKIVFLTIHEEDEKIFEAIRQGAQGYLPKHISALQLLSFLRGLERGDYAIDPEYTRRIIDKFAHSPMHENLTNEKTSVLTIRQLQILRELRTGATNKEIAKRLVISEQTVKNHVSQILKKLNLKSRRELI